MAHNALDLRQVLVALHEGLAVLLLGALAGQLHSQLGRGFSLQRQQPMCHGAWSKQQG